MLMTKNIYDSDSDSGSIECNGTAYEFQLPGV